uniref:Family with sequence similarity 234 member A n=1 Tax=Oryzias latipes TaxID=8090 RepID=A0A3P9J350_ORYLA
MESTERATEGDPLRTEDGAETAPPASEQRDSIKYVDVPKRTHWRTAIFFLSLFLCLTIVFAFSFILPCPVRAQYLKTWNRTFSDAATYDFLAIEHASSDHVVDILFVLKNTEGSKNNSCADAGLRSPCLFFIGVDGTKGETLWETPLEAEFYWAQCGQQKEAEKSWHCLLSHSHNLTAIDKYTGKVIWQQPKPTGLQSSLPFLTVPDLDGDKVSDVLLVASNSTQTQLVLLSGKTGVQMGSTVVLDFTDTVSHVLHRTKEGSYYILLQKDTGVYGLPLWRIAGKAALKVELKKDIHLEKNTSDSAPLIPIFEFNGVSMLRTKKTSDPSDMLVVTSNGVVLIDGNKLQPRWRFNTSAVISELSFGHFNKDEILDVVVEDNTGNNTKRVVILDGQSGDVLWEVDLLAAANSPKPGSVYTTKSISVFMFWGLMPSNSSESLVGNRCSYMLLPHYPKVLLEYSNVMEHIIAFKATLMELGRHAAYILLTGPQTKGANGTVVLTKRKLKQDVTLSNVLRIGSVEDSETNEAIKEAFNRLRFSSQ